MQKDYFPELTGFGDIPRHYLQERAFKAEAEMEWFGEQSQTISEAIERACASIYEGRLHTHQWRPFQKWPRAPQDAADLLKLQASRIAEAGTFEDDLYPMIHTAIASPRCKGIGPLACYDIARRIGAWLRPKLKPTEVYLHRGTRDGAKAVRCPQADRRRASMRDFPEALRRLLTAAQLEDVLCIYRGTLTRIADSGEVRAISRDLARCGFAPRALRPGRC
jgi:hypothetical protein